MCIKNEANEMKMSIVYFYFLVPFACTKFLYEVRKRAVLTCIDIFVIDHYCYFHDTFDRNLTLTHLKALICA